MLQQKWILSASLCVAVLVGMNQTSSAIELAVNGGFETGDFTGWTQFPTGPGQQTVDSVNPSSGTYSGAISNDVDFSNSLFKQANLAAGLLTPGQTVTVSFDARGSYAVPGGVAFAELFSELSGGGTSKAELLGGAPLAINPDPNVWTTFNFVSTLGPDVSGGVTLQLGATNGPGNPTNMWYDNVSVTVDSLIPEPTSFTLLGLAGLALIGRRSR